MDAIGESVENVGLAQEIQKGLAKSLQKVPKFADWQAEIDAKAAEIDAMEPLAAYEIGLVSKLFKEWGRYNNMDLSLGRRKSSAGTPDSVFKPPTPDGIKANWGDFKVSQHYSQIAKYLICADKIAGVPTTAKDFEEMRPLGKGAFGAVFLTFKKDTGSALAVKKTTKTLAKRNKMIKDIMIEREVLSKMRSIFCVNLHYAYHDKDVAYLVLTLCPGGDLSFLLKAQYTTVKKESKFTPFPDGTVKFYGASMACGLQAIHDAGYVYRDLKPQNVLLDESGKVRISDMGLTADISKGSIKQCSGTRGYWSPETVKKEKYTIEPDWWSLGVTMYCLQSDRLPFKGKSDEEKDAATVAGVIEYTHDEPEDLQQIINALCKVDMKERLGCNGGLEQFKAHPYFASFEWDKLIGGYMEAPIKPNVNDINAPSKADIGKFDRVKDVEWTDDDEKQFDTWQYMDKELWHDEAIFRMKNRKEIPIEGGGGGGGGCCTIA